MLCAVTWPTRVGMDSSQNIRVVRAGEGAGRLRSWRLLSPRRRAVAKCNQLKSENRSLVQK